MVQILPPYKPEVDPTEPGLRVSVAPSPHIRFTNDVGYYDAMGRDPLQMFQVWGIKDRTDKILKLKETVLEFPGIRHRRHLLQDAAIRGDEVVVKCLVDTGLKVNPEQNDDPPATDDDEWEDEDNDDDPDKDDLTIAPFHVAANRGRLECVRIMLEDGNVGIDVRDEVGRTALIAAAQAGNADMVKYLLGQGANPTFRVYPKNKIAQEYFGKLAGGDALEFAAARGSLETVKLLLEHPIYGSTRRRAWKEGPEPGVYVTPLAIYMAAGSHKFETLEYLLDRGSWPMNEKDDQSRAEQLNETQKRTLKSSTAHLIENGDYKSIQMMLSYTHPTDASGKVLPFDVSKNLHRPFIWGAYEAIIRGDIDKFDWIYDFGLKEHGSMSLDELPEGQLINIQHLFDKAATVGQTGSMKMLIEKHGAKPDVSRVPPAVRPVYTAAMNDKPEAVEYLLKNHSIDIHHGNGQYATGPTALFVAIAMKSFKSIELLLQAGGPVDEIDSEIQHIAAPLSAVLIADFKTRAPVRLVTEQSAQAYIDGRRGNWQDFNPGYVRLDLVPEDKEWICKLVPRRSDDELAETGVMARRLNSKDKSRSNPAPHLPDWPTEQSRADELQGDDDIMPAWKAMLVGF